MLKAKIKPKRKINAKVLEKRRREPCWVCNATPTDASHITSRGAGGGDEEWNVVAHCRKHHTEWHRYGWSKFFEKYPHFALKLKYMGWEWGEGKLRFTHRVAEIHGCF